MASIEKRVRKHGKKIAVFERFVNVEFPGFKKDVMKILTNGSLRKMAMWQFLTLLLTVIIGFLSIILNQ